MIQPLTSGPVKDTLENHLEIVPGSIESIGSLIDAFDGTVAYDRLRALKPRFHPYLWEDEKAFVKWFGDDVDPVDHGPHQARTVTIPFLRAEEECAESKFEELSDPRTQQLLVARTVVHDYHEGTWAWVRRVDRDVNQAAKTKENEIEERGWHLQTLYEVYGRPFQERLRFFTRRTEDGRTRIHSAWNYIERYGYLNRALRAQEGVESERLTKEQRQKCHAMAIGVTGRSYAIVEQYRRRFVHADQFMIDAAPIFARIRRAHGEQAWKGAINAPK